MAGSCAEEGVGDMDEFAARLKESRAKSGLTQKELAAKVGIAAATLSAYEASGKPPTIETAMKLADILGVSLDWLCGRDEANERLETYGDVIALIDRLVRSKMAVTVEALRNKGDGKLMAVIVIEDEVLAEFFAKWDGALTLYRAKTIGDEIYEPWLEKQIVLRRERLPG